MLESLYIIQDRGDPLFFYSSTADAHTTDEEQLFSGVINAVQNMLRGINAGEMKKFTTSNYLVAMYPQRKYAYAFISNVNENLTDTDFDLLAVMLQKKLKWMLERVKNQSVFVSTNEKLLNSTIRDILEEWGHKISETRAVKKAKESLW